MEGNALMNIIVMGAPGVGKGTYTELISKKYNLPHISTGDMFRSEAKKGTKIGNMAREVMEAGGLMPDDITNKLLKKRLKQKDCKDGFILDGYPRSIEQAKALEKITNTDKVINFVANDEIIIDRVSGRIVCRKCGATYHEKNIPPKKPGVCDSCGGELYRRQDDEPDVVRKRLQVYYEKTAPLIDYYKDKGMLVNVDLSGPYREYPKVLEQVERALAVLGAY